MTDKDKIKFAIRYLKQGLKSKRTPPLYEELMKELGFEKNKAVQELEKENAVLKKRNIKDCKNFNRAVEKIGEQLNQKQYQLTKAKDLIRNIVRVTWGEGWNYSLEWKVKAEEFLNSEVSKR